MNFSKCLLFRRLSVLVAAAVVLSAVGVAIAQPVVVMDGRDEANLASEGNHGTFHANVNFAFTYGQVAATNLVPNPPGPSSPSFNYQSTATPDGGGLGFGTNQLAFNANRAFAQISLTVNPGNTLGAITLILKDTDAPTFAAEDLQYSIPLPAVPGNYVLTRTLNNPTFVFNQKDGIANFQAGGLGMSELQLQYPFGIAEPRPNMDLTIHDIRIRVPEPSTIALTGLSGLAMCARMRRRRSA